MSNGIYGEERREEGSQRIYARRLLLALANSLRAEDLSIVQTLASLQLAITSISIESRHMFYTNLRTVFIIAPRKNSLDVSSR